MNGQASDLPASGPVIACAVYAGGVRVADISVDQISEALVVPDQFVWLGLYEPDHALLRQIQEELGLHDLAIEDAVKAHQRPKAEAVKPATATVPAATTPAAKPAEAVKK